MLKFNQVSFYYKKDTPIFKNSTVTIQQAEFVSIVGPNGCGKSTMAKLMNGLLLPNQGTVQYLHLDTKNPADLLAIRQKVGFVFQNPEDQFITTSVLDEVIFGLENIRVPRDEMETRAQAALQLVQMEDYMDSKPHELSGGQKQRVAIAAIIAMEPQVIIFDEATSMLDPEGRKQILTIMHALHQKGMTIIHITHHMDEVFQADRILLVHQGQISFDGPPTLFFETIPVATYQLQLPFAVRLQQSLKQKWAFSSDWKGAIRSQWPTN